MFVSRAYTNRVFEGCSERETDADGSVTEVKHDCVPVSYKFGKWIFLGCLVISISLVSDVGLFNGFVDRGRSAIIAHLGWVEGEGGHS